MVRALQPQKHGGFLVVAVGGASGEEDISVTRLSIEIKLKRFVFSYYIHPKNNDSLFTPPPTIEFVLTIERFN